MALIGDPGFRSIRDVEACLDQETLDARELQEIWDCREPLPREAKSESAGAAGSSSEGRVIPWLQESPQLARRFVEHAIAAGEFLLACDAAREALRIHGDAGLRQDLARALLGLGAHQDALEELRLLEEAKGLTDRMRCKTLLLNGDVHFEEAEAQAAPENREAQRSAALDAYRAALAIRSGEHEAALKVAVTQLLIAQLQLADGLSLEESAASSTLTADPGRAQAVSFETKAKEAAQHALGLIEKAMKESEQIEAEFDLLVSRAEARCILGLFQEADADYRSAVGLGRMPAHKLAAARSRARLIAGAKRALSPNEETKESFFDGCFPPLQLIVFSGHMIDLSGRVPPRFPESAEDRVRALIEAKLEDLKASVGFSSAAAGADLIFFEEMLRRPGAQVHVVLPWARDAFLETSVVRAGDRWVRRFNDALARAASVRVLGELHLPSDRVGYQYANAVMGGLARLTARALGLDLLPLALWDRLPGKPGGTSDFVEFWHSQALAPEIIRLAPPEADRDGANSSEARLPWAPAVKAKKTLRQEIKTMLFADIVGYSRLPEAVIPDFVREFMGGVSRVVADSPHSPISVNTWGDAVYFVFDSAPAAGLFALELMEMIEETDWEERGVFWEEAVAGRTIRRPLRIRTALHSGPVYVHFDPVVRRLGYTGAHVSRAARIEPITAEGEVFASEEFAALATVERASGFACHFVGTMPLAKKYPGTFRIYRVRRIQSFPLDSLARLIHESYCRERAADGDTPAKNSSLGPWEDLPADLRASNREQAADLPAKLRAIGYELITSPRSQVIQGAVPPDDPEFVAALHEKEEFLAVWEHDRWCRSKRRWGWTEGPRADKAKQHPNLVPWDRLDTATKNKDREAVRNIPFLTASAGFRVRKLQATVQAAGHGG